MTMLYIIYAQNDDMGIIIRKSWRQVKGKKPVGGRWNMRHIIKTKHVWKKWHKMVGVSYWEKLRNKTIGKDIKLSGMQSTSCLVWRSVWVRKKIGGILNLMKSPSRLRKYALYPQVLILPLYCSYQITSLPLSSCLIVGIYTWHAIEAKALFSDRQFEGWFKMACRLSVSIRGDLSHCFAGTMMI